MKKYPKILISCCCLFLIVLACTKEVGLITEVEFDLMEQHTAEGFVNQGLPTTFTILPEEILENYEYNITYEILEGDGYFEDIDGNRLKAGEGQSVPTDLTSSLMYMGSETGAHRVKITGADNFGLSQEIEVMYDLSDVPVIWEASSELSELERETPVDLLLLFETLDGALDVDYEAMFGFNSGSGSLEPSEENGYVLSGEYNSIVPGTSPFVFTPSELGPQQLVFTLRDSNGQEIEALLDFNVVEFIDVISISLVSQDTVKMKLGDEIPPAFTFDPPNATDQGVTVVSSDPDVVFIDENNVCIAVGLGTAEVTVTSVSNPEASDTVTVVVIEADRIPVTGITVSQEDPGATGTERQLLATVLPEDATDPSVTWSSSDDTIASIDENGLLTGLSAGTATITATSVSDPDIKGVVQIEITGVSLLSANNIETFALKDQIETATIDPVTHTVSITVLEGTPLNVAPIMLTVSEGATIAPGLLQARDFSSPVEYTVTSGNGTEQVWTVNAKVLTIPVAGETNITGFELAGQNSSTINTTDRTVTVNVPDGTELNVAPQVLEVSPDATVAPAIGQVQDFSEAVTYTVTPETGTPQVWTVNVTVSAPPGSDQNAITAFELLGQTDVAIDDTAGTVTVTVPNGTNLSAAPSVLNVSENATVNPAIGDVQDFSGAVTYTVTAENTDERVWTVNVIELPPAPEGSDQNAIIAFGLTGQTDVAIDDTAGTVTITVTNGTELNSAPSVLNISPNATVNPAIGDAQDFSGAVTYTVTAENGDEREWTVNVTELLPVPTESGANDITAFVIAGQNSSSFDSNNSIISVNVPDGTDLNVAPQNLEVSLDATILPAIDVVQDFNTQVVYTVTAENGDEQDWTVNVTVSAPKENDENAITAFELTGQTDVNIDDTTSTITVTVPNDTDLNTAPSVLNVSENATVNPAIGDVQDFSGAVTYTVTAENTDERVWTVNVNVTSSSNKSIDSFMVNEVSGTFNGTDISLTLPFGTDVTALSPEIEFFGQSVNPASGTPTDFTSDVVYTVTADDNSTLDYTVAIIIAAKTNTAPTTEDFPVIVQQDSNNNSIDLSPHINDDDDGDVLTVSIISDFENGVVTVSGTTLIYTPTPGYNGGDTIVYTVDDGSGGNVRGAVNVTVMPANSNNQSPTAESSADVTNGDAPLTVSFTGNTSSDPDNDTLSYLWDFGDGSTSTLQNPSHVFESPITYNVILTVTDDGSPSLSDEASAITIEAGNANQFPVAVALANTTNGNAPLTVNFTGSNSSDPDSGDTLSYLWDFGDGSTSTQENPSHEFAAGTYDVVLTVTDDASQPRSNSATAIRIEAGIANRIPVAVSSADAINGNAPLTVKFTGSTSSDPDDDDLSYIWSFGDGSTSISEDPTHEFSAPGTYEVVLTVTDNGIPVLSNAATAITIEVDQANQIPIARALADITSGVGPLTVKFTGSTSSDPDDDSLSYFWDFGDGGTSTSDDPTHKFSAADTYNVVLTVTDDGNPVRSNSVSLSIEVDPNIAPVAVDDNFSVDEAGNLNRLILTNDTDDENNDLTVNWVGGSAANVGQAVGGSDGGLFTIAAGGGLNFNTNNDFDGLNDGETQTTTIQYRITDGNSNSNTATVTVTVTGVSPVNQSPTARASADDTNGNAPLTVNFTGSTSSDPNLGDTLSYLWNFGDGSISTSADPTHEFSAAGTYDVILTVTDDGSPVRSNSAAAIRIEAGQANQSPTARASADVTSGIPGLTVKFTGNTSTDPDIGDTLSYLWEFGENNMTSTEENPMYQYVSPGDYNVVLTVTDNGSPARSDVATAITITVNQANQSPVARASADETSGTPGLTVNFKGNTSTDPDIGDTLSYLWEFGENNKTSTEENPMYQYVSPGVYNVTLTVTDDYGAEDSTTMTVTVEDAPVNIAPTADAGPNQNITLPTNSVTLNGKDSKDADGNIKSYNWTRVGGTGTINNPNSESTSVTGLTTVGSYTFILTVTDNDDAESSDLVIVTVSNPAVPKATFSSPQNVSSPSQTSVSGTVTITGGPMTFNFGMTSMMRTGTITFTIDGTPYAVTVFEGESKNILVPKVFIPGTYSYSLTLSGSGNYNGGVTAEGL